MTAMRMMLERAANVVLALHRRFAGCQVLCPTRVCDMYWILLGFLFHGIRSVSSVNRLSTRRLPSCCPPASFPSRSMPS